MFCTKCGAQIDDTAKFCTRCGAKIEKPVPAAEAPEAPAQQPAETPVQQPVEVPAQQPAEAAAQLPEENQPEEASAAVPGEEPVSEAPAAEAPAVEAPEAPEAAPAPEASPIFADAPVAEGKKKKVKEPKTEKKKGKKALVISLSILLTLVLIAGAVFALWYFSPEQSMLRALKADDLYEALAIYQNRMPGEEPDAIVDAVEEKLNYARSCYLDGDMDFPAAMEDILNIEEMGIPSLVEAVAETKDLVTRVKDSRAAFAHGEEFFASGDYRDAMMMYAFVIVEDDNYASAQSRLEEALDLYVQDVLTTAGEYADEGCFDEAIAELETGLQVLPENPLLTDAVNVYQIAAVEQAAAEALVGTWKCEIDLAGPIAAEIARGVGEELPVDEALDLPVLFTFNRDRTFISSVDTAAFEEAADTYFAALANAMAEYLYQDAADKGADKAAFDSAFQKEFGMDVLAYCEQTLKSIDTSVFTETSINFTGSFKADGSRIYIGRFPGDFSEDCYLEYTVDGAALKITNDEGSFLGLEDLEGLGIVIPLVFEKQ